jgi:hypothetical protein
MVGARRKMKKSEIVEIKKSTKGKSVLWESKTNNISIKRVPEPLVLNRKNDFITTNENPIEHTLIFLKQSEFRRRYI